MCGSFIQVTTAATIPRMGTSCSTRRIQRGIRPLKRPCRCDVSAAVASAGGAAKGDASSGVIAEGIPVLSGPFSSELSGSVRSVRNDQVASLPWQPVRRAADRRRGLLAGRRHGRDGGLADPRRGLQPLLDTARHGGANRRRAAHPAPSIGLPRERRRRRTGHRSRRGPGRHGGRADRGVPTAVRRGRTTCGAVVSGRGDVVGAGGVRRREVRPRSLRAHVAAARRRAVRQATLPMPGAQVYVGVSLARDATTPGGGLGEGVGIAAAVLVLLFVFGSVIAALMPIATAAVAIVTGLGIVKLLVGVYPFNDTAPQLATMLGLGAGVG